MVKDKKFVVGIYARINEKYAQELKEQEEKRKDKKLQMISLFNQWKNETFRGYRLDLGVRVNLNERMKLMLTNQVINGEKKLKVFYRRAREVGQLEKQMETDYQYRQSLMPHEFIEINEGNASATKFKKRSCIHQLIKLIELGNVDTLYAYDASRLTRNMSNHFELMALLNKHNVRLVFTGSSEIDMPNKLLGLWEGNKIG